MITNVEIPRSRCPASVNECMHVVFEIEDAISDGVPASLTIPAEIWGSVEVGDTIVINDTIITIGATEDLTTNTTGGTTAEDVLSVVAEMYGLKDFAFSVVDGTLVIDSIKCQDSINATFVLASEPTNNIYTQLSQPPSRIENYSICATLQCKVDGVFQDLQNGEFAVTAKADIDNCTVVADRAMKDISTFARDCVSCPKPDCFPLEAGQLQYQFMPEMTAMLRLCYTEVYGSPATAHNAQISGEFTVTSLGQDTCTNFLLTPYKHGDSLSCTQCLGAFLYLPDIIGGEVDITVKFEYFFPDGTLLGMIEQELGVIDTLDSYIWIRIDPCQAEALLNQQTGVPVNTYQVSFTENVSGFVSDAIMFKSMKTDCSLDIHFKDKDFGWSSLAVNCATNNTLNTVHSYIDTCRSCNSERKNFKSTNVETFIDYTTYFFCETRSDLICRFMMAEEHCLLVDGEYIPVKIIDSSFDLNSRIISPERKLVFRVEGCEI